MHIIRAGYLTEAFINHKKILTSSDMSIEDKPKWGRCQILSPNKAGLGKFSS